MGDEVRRHFVTIDGRWGPRQVHYRRAGRGPAVLLLHQSPQSSREMVDLMRRWSLHFTVIAPDTPGYGQSDPIGAADLGVGELAEALLEFVNAIGLHRFGIYGYHTGASIGVWLAAAHPERVSAIAANGLAWFNDAERDVILRDYLPPLVPRWDGSHLAWLWARVREQAVFFPWHLRSAATRMQLDMPPPDRLHASLLDFLRSGEHYACAYRAAFQSRPQAVLGGFTTPTLVTAADGDPLQAHLERITGEPRDLQAVASASTAEVLERCLAQLLSHRGDPCPAPVSTRPVAGRLWQRMVGTPAGQRRVRVELSGRAAPLLYAHGAGESADAACRLAEPLIGTRPLVLPDLPGHGESDGPGPGDGPTVAQCADSNLQVMRELGLPQFVAAGRGAGAWVAVETLRIAGARRPALALLEPPLMPESLQAACRARGLPPIEPQWHGGHLLLAWHMLRDRQLFFPWFDRRHAAAVGGEPDLDEARLQAALLDLLRAEGAWQSLAADAMDYPARTSLADLAASCVAGAAPDSPWHGATRALAGAVPGALPVDLEPEPRGWLATVLGRLH